MVQQGTQQIYDDDRGLAVSDIFQGIFWVICSYGDGTRPDLQNFELLSFKVPCDTNGEVLSCHTELNSKSGKSFNHRMQWESLQNKTTQQHSYQFYPRGRVEIRRKSALIFLNPWINDRMVIDQIEIAFGLNHPDLKAVKIKCDGSKHYHCWLDDSTIP